MFNLIFPIVAIVWEKLWNTFDKINFNKTNLKPSNQIFLVFIMMFLGAIIWFFVTWEKLPNFSIKLWLLIFVIIGISFFQNIFQFHWISKKDLQTREPIILLNPIITAGISYIIFPSEREYKYIIAIVLAILVLYIFKFRKNFKIDFDRWFLLIFLWVTCSAILANMYKFWLQIITPELLLVLRTSGILLLLLLCNQVLINRKNFPINALNIWFISWFFYFAWHLARLYSIQELWLNLTVLLLFLWPVFMFLFSFFILKEKVEFKNIISSFLILFIIICTVIL